MWLEPARLEFGPDGTPFSATYGDIYHSAAGGPEQARHVFLGGNGLPARWQGRERFVILETGFGLGLNFLATWAAWQADPQRCRRLHFVSVEKHPFSAGDLQTAQAAWPEFAPLAEALRERWPPLVPGVHRLNLAGGQVVLTVVFGDASEVLKKLDAAVDAFYLDGFSPAKNPELWSPSLCRTLARLAAPGATLATWSVAGGLREALAGAEFDLEKRLGFAGKREMLVGHYRSRKPASHGLPADRRAIVLGAGAAGSTAAHRLAARGWQVTVLERNAAPGQGASGNIAGVLRPLPSVDDNRLARLTRAGYLATRGLLRDLGEAVRWAPCGVLHLARDAAHEEVQRRTADTLGPPPEFFQFIDREAASARLKWPVSTGGWWFPNGGWVQPFSLCRAAIGAFPERVAARFGVAVARLERQEGEWQALAADGTLLAAAPHLVVAGGAEATRFPQLAWLPQKAARGQVTHIPEGATPPLDVVLCRLGYATPAVDGLRVAGASFTVGDDDPAERLTDHQDNLARLDLILPGFARDLDPAALHGRVGFRPASPDRLPMVGPVAEGTPAGTNGRLHDLPLQPGLWCVQGFGARGIVWSALMGELLASRMDGDPLPLETDLADALDPGRFLLKTARRHRLPDDPA